MANGTVELVYVPQIGRVMRYAKIGAANILWENKKFEGKTASAMKKGDWANFGGDKLWPAPQSLWHWPPDPILDGAPYQVEVREKSLKITGLSSAKSGVKFDRQIRMDPSGTVVHIVNRMTNTSAKTQELAVWEIVQTDDPDQILIPLELTDNMPLGWAPFDDNPVNPDFVTTRNGFLVVRRYPRLGSKLGSASSKGILTIQRKGVEFSFSAKKSPGKYFDNGRFLQVYTNGDPDKYVELEILGPSTKLEPGQAATLRTTWLLREAK